MFYSFKQVHETIEVVTDTLERLRYLNVTHAWGNEKNVQTASRTPKPVNMASVGVNDYRTGIRDVESLIGGQGHTIPKSWPREMVAETFERADTALSSNFIIL